MDHRPAQDRDAFGAQPAAETSQARLVRVSKQRFEGLLCFDQWARVTMQIDECVLEHHPMVSRVFASEAHIRAARRQQFVELVATLHARSGCGAIHRLREPKEPLASDLAHQPALISKVVVRGLVRDFRPTSHLANAHPAHALLRDERGRGIQNLFPKISHLLSNMQNCLDSVNLRTRHCHVTMTLRIGDPAQTPANSVLSRACSAPAGGWLVPAACVQGIGALIFGLWLLVDAAPLLGVHPGLKPFKFLVSGALLCATMAWVLPLLSAPRRHVDFVGGLVTVTLLTEQVAIGGQALRGVTSHFNEQGWFNALVWSTMGAAISVTTLSLLWAARVATKGPLRAPSGKVLGRPIALTIRAALWLFSMAAISGFTMGGLSSHSVGGIDGGPGLPLLNWSTTHGDLRVSHFFALHALQVLPLFGYLMSRLQLGEPGKLRLTRLGVAAYTCVVLGAFILALFGRPAWEPSGTVGPATARVDTPAHAPPSCACSDL